MTAADGPLVWGLLGRNAGDNAQVRSLVEALGYRFVLKPLAFNRLSLAPNLVLGASRLSLAGRGQGEKLAPPWPNLVVCAGRRSVPAARWIRARSGGRARLVQLGRPQAPLRCFDLIVTTPQYGLPRRGNIVHNLLPFQPPAEVSDRAVAVWRRTLSPRPRPWIALLVGGAAWPFAFGPAEAGTLAARASRAAARRGGTLLVSTSPRTGPAATEALAADLEGSFILNDWRDPKADFYRSALRLADRFVVTGDSVSMMAEAIGTSRPVEIYDLPLLSASLACLTRLAETPALAGAAHLGLGLPPRDAGRVRDALIARGAAASFGDPDPAGAIDAARERRATVERIRSLVEGRAARVSSEAAGQAYRISREPSE